MDERRGQDGSRRWHGGVGCVRHVMGQRRHQRDLLLGPGDLVNIVKTLGRLGGTVTRAIGDHHTHAGIHARKDRGPVLSKDPWHKGDPFVAGRNDTQRLGVVRIVGLGQTKIEFVFLGFLFVFVKHQSCHVARIRSQELDLLVAARQQKALSFFEVVDHSSWSSKVLHARV